MNAATMARRGRNRELQVRDRLRAEGWVIFRCHLSVADLVALKAGETPRMIEVKSTSTRGPWNDFGPAARQALCDAAEQAGAEAWLVHWPLHGECRWIPADEWPTP